MFDGQGNRKYLTYAEREAFLIKAEVFPDEITIFCQVLAFTGCRISEALALTPSRLDAAQGVLVFESLKKRRRGVYRAVPIPDALVSRLLKMAEATETSHRIWPWARNTAWRHVSKVMKQAEISGPHATPKGLRHAFGVIAVQNNIPLNLVQRWLGHAHLETTAIYADVTGTEERTIAQRMWGLNSH
ncbi:MAG: site-specific integrase [Cohaesibacter sp.]|nr:site-specific integrase [Cohaesibacter sp.]